ncbi:hypothetical protein BDA99DRAFT_604334 [Phascolomyces articulosus]|uniref:Uncharacterized protein n=1 Tax=Phascolomyces articulosus TaxID=60185 RepID=A0AAD5KBR5_9FUNG|nr:hypothetical protein BDA99DRAFT_604334 [Phascolomyces articulosus]
MTSLIIDNAGNIASMAISIIQEKADDWKQVVPEAHDFKRECEHFLNIIHALKPPVIVKEEKKPSLQQNNKLTTAFNTVRSVKAMAAQLQNLGSSNHSDHQKSRSSDSEKHEVILDDHGDITNNSNNTNNNEEAAQQQINNKDENGQVIANGHGNEYQQQQQNNMYSKIQRRRSILGNSISRKKKKAQSKEEEEDRGMHAIIQEILHHISGAQKRLEEFLKENDQKRTRWRYTIRWFFKRAIIAGEYRGFFRDESTAIRGLLNDLVLCQKIAEKAAIPKVDDFQKDMSEEAYLFWKKHMGQLVIAQWNQFIDSYVLLFGTPEPYDLAYIERMLTNKSTNSSAQQHHAHNDQITVYAFISFCKKHGFPFKKNIATTLMETEPVMSEEGRMEVTKMVMQMVSDFSAREMQDHLIALYVWFKGLERNDIEGYQKRANEWAHLVKASRGIDEINWSEQHKKAVEVDKARRTISFFYQKYMVMWRVGQVSRETIKDVDFPGRNRIKDFIRVCMPLDKANYTIVIGKSEGWEDHMPKVYKFLEKHIAMTGSNKPKKSSKTVGGDEQQSQKQQEPLSRGTGSKILQDTVIEELDIKKKGKETLS